VEGHADVIIESDFNWSNDDESEGAPLSQQYAWFWDKGQQLPHKISDDVYDVIKNQVKVSSFLYLKSDANELMLMTEVPNLARPYRAVSAVVDTDWFPASYPWHCVLELDPRERTIEIKKGDPLCRVLPVRRDTYFAKADVAERVRRLLPAWTGLARRPWPHARGGRGWPSPGHHAHVREAADEEPLCGDEVVVGG
jgi:hypothetical protein